jgi:hypothetical protein
LRLDHWHDQALCRRGGNDLTFDHRHNAAKRYPSSIADFTYRTGVLAGDASLLFILVLQSLFLDL